MVPAIAPSAIASSVLTYDYFNRCLAVIEMGITWTLYAHYIHHPHDPYLPKIHGKRQLMV